LSTPSPYSLVPRATHKKTGSPLSGYALDITIRANHTGAYFLDDHNNPGNVMPHNNVFELMETLVGTIGRNHEARFGK
jgi:hypothetical protein